MRWFRLIGILILAVGLAPGTFVRSIALPTDFNAPLHVTSLAEAVGVTDAGSTLGSITLLNAWRLDSRNAHFHGFSALAYLGGADKGGGRLLAGSDRGRLLTMPLPQNADPQTSIFSFFAGTRGGPRILVDLEALEYDTATGRVWGAYEQNGGIQRFSLNNPEQAPDGVNIPAMKGWAENGGAETMVRLDDGRFIIIAESGYSNRRPGLLFAGDPLKNDTPVKFRFVPPDGYSPVDATVLPDGRVMILVRRVVWGIPPRFATALVLADPEKIEEGEAWSGTIVARIEGPDLDENFEGIAAVPQSDRTNLANDIASDTALELYLIADDNQSLFQDTLMLRLGWEPARIQPEPAISVPDDKQAR